MMHILVQKLMRFLRWHVVKKFFAAGIEIVNGLTVAGTGVANGLCPYGVLLMNGFAAVAGGNTTVAVLPFSSSTQVFDAMIRCAASAFSASSVTGPHLLPLASV